MRTVEEKGLSGDACASYLCNLGESQTERWFAQQRYDELHLSNPSGVAGDDVGIKQLATLSQPTPGASDKDGHVENPRVLDEQLRRILRRIERCQDGSKNRNKLLLRRASLHERISNTCAFHLHALANTLVGGFDLVGIGDLNVKGMSHKERRLGSHLADASLGELRRLLSYKTIDHGHRLVVVGRFHQSSKTCSNCGAVKAKLPVHV